MNMNKNKNKKNQTILYIYYIYNINKILDNINKIFNKILKIRLGELLKALVFSNDKFIRNNKNTSKFFYASIFKIHIPLKWEALCRSVQLHAFQFIKQIRMPCHPLSLLRHSLANDSRKKLAAKDGKLHVRRFDNDNGVNKGLWPGKILFIFGFYCFEFLSNFGQIFCENYTCFKRKN